MAAGTRSGAEVYVVIPSIIRRKAYAMVQLCMD